MLHALRVFGTIGAVIIVSGFLIWWIELIPRANKVIKEFVKGCKV